MEAGQETAERADEQPVLITVAEAERLCSLPPRSGYPLVDREWKDFVVRFGKWGIRINRAKLLEWANGSPSGDAAEVA